jgi:hypothetical protein
MIDLEFEVDPPIEQIKYWVERLEKETLSDLTEFWKKWASPAVIEEIGRIFATEGYGSWPPLSPKYKLRKSKLYPGKRILRATDTYFTAATKKGSAGNAFFVEPDSMVWGVDLGWFASAFDFPYPAALERGNTRGMPARPVFEIAEQSRNLENNLVAALKDYLDKTIRRETKRYFGNRV